MNQAPIQGEIIDEYSVRCRQIQYEIEELLALVAAAHHFNWTAPLHDIVRSLMNQVHEFRPIDEDNL
ncbi:hypothetical protein ES702_06247 [subsurface metagenome]